MQLTSIDNLHSHVVTIEATTKKKATTDLCELVDPELLEPLAVFFIFIGELVSFYLLGPVNRVANSLH